MSTTWLIVGLGNPGSKYKNTRHNIGFLLMDLVAANFQVSFKMQSKFYGEVASIAFQGDKLHLLKPMTYMNESGKSVEKCLSYLGCDKDRMVVVCDDVAIPFGSLRLKTQGSSGGHNGLKSVQKSLGTAFYSRLRMGINGSGDYRDLAEYVLAPFLEAEQKVLPSFLERGKEALLRLVKEPVEKVMNDVNQPPNGDKNE